MLSINGHNFIEASREGNIKIINEFLNTKISNYLIKEYGEFALKNACYFGKEEVVNLLITYIDDLNIQNKMNGTALIWACAGNIFLNEKSNSSTMEYEFRYIINNNIVRKLIENNVDYNLQDNQGYSALMCACENNNIGLVKLLLKLNTFRYGKINCNLQNKDGETALSIASKYKYNKLKNIIILELRSRFIKKLKYSYLYYNLPDDIIYYIVTFVI